MLGGNPTVELALISPLFGREETEVGLLFLIRSNFVQGVLHVSDANAVDIQNCDQVESPVLRKAFHDAPGFARSGCVTNSPAVRGEKGAKHN